MADTPITDVQDTALWIAHFRAVESARPDALFHDPYAALLSGERGAEIARTMPGKRTVNWSVAIRTVIIDSYIRSAIADGYDTVLSLGAGLDARPYRMELPSTLHWIEVDYPTMIAYKEERLQSATPRCRLDRIKLDLADTEARRRLLKDVAAKSNHVLVLTEGVIPYLDDAAVASLADDLAALPPFRRWIVDYFAPQMLEYMRRGSIQKKMQNAPFKFRPDDWAAFFLQHHWRVRIMRYLGEESKTLGRPSPMPLYVKAMLLFMPAAKRAAMNRMTAYALLERA